MAVLVLGMVTALVLAACSDSSAGKTADPTASPKTSATESAPGKTAALEGAVHIEASYADGSMSAKVGHTDNVADTNVGNQKLSENRAEAVKSVLVGRPELKDYIYTASGKGESEPVVDNKDDESRARNRRVQVTVSTPVKKEILELQAASQEMPPPVAQESTWPQPVLFDTNRGKRGEPRVVEIKASEATAYPNYTLITYTVKSISVETMWMYALQVGKQHRGEIGVQSAPPRVFMVQISCAVPPALCLWNTSGPAVSKSRRIPC